MGEGVRRGETLGGVFGVMKYPGRRDKGRESSRAAVSVLMFTNATPGLYS